MKTEALFYLGEREIKYRDVELPEPEAHELFVEMEICGICGWDLLAYAGRFAEIPSLSIPRGTRGSRPRGQGWAPRSGHIRRAAGGLP